MNHLTDEQLAARLDRALAPRDADAVAAHLAGCEACRERLAKLVAADAALAGALARDPGEAYFAAFPARVAARIAAQAASGAPAQAPRARAWWNSPRWLAWAGSAFGVLVVAALALVLSRQHGIEQFRRDQASRVRSGSAAPAAPSPAAPARTSGASTAAPGTPAAGAPAGSGASAAAPATPAAGARRAAEPADALARRAQVHAAEPAARTAGTGGGPLAREEKRAAGQEAAKSALPPQNVQQVRDLGNGESVPVAQANRPPAQQPSGRAFGALDQQRPPKPMASPLASRSLAPAAKGAPGAAASLAAPAPLAGAEAPPEVAKESEAIRARGGRANEISTGAELPGVQALADSAVISWQDALQTDALASREGTAPAWMNAGRAWERAVAFAQDDDTALAARRYLAHARLAAWRIERTSAHRVAVLAAVDSLLSAAPTGDVREEALRWRAEVIAAGPPRP